MAVVQTNKQGLQSSYKRGADNNIFQREKSSLSGNKEIRGNVEIDGVLTLSDGSGTGPSLSFTDDLNSGIYRTGEDAFDIVSGGVSQMSFSTSGISLSSGVTISSILDEDAMGSDSVTALSTQQSIKAYVDATVVPNGSDSQIQFNNSSSFGSSSNFVWDDANERFGVGDTISGLTITTSDYGSIGVGIGSTAEGATPLGDNIASFSAIRHTDGATNIPAIIVGIRSRGTVSTPVNVAASDDLFLMAGYGYFDGTYYPYSSIHFRTDSSGTISATSAPGKIIFTTTPDSSITATDRMEIDMDGLVSISGTSVVGSGVAAVDARFSVFADSSKNAVEFQGSDQTSANSVIIAKDSATNELFEVFNDGTVSIGAAAPSASAILHIESTTKGLLMPRMTSTQGSAITGVNGLIIYVTDTDATFTSVGFWGYQNGAWGKL